MNGYLNTYEKTECFGCGACVQACPKGAISMRNDEEGFLYPQIDKTECMHCNCCHKVCPVEAAIALSSPKIGYIGYNVEVNTRLQSASGGAFKAIIDALGSDTIVFGAEWATRSLAVHSWAPAERAYERFSGSKYVQSQIGTSFSECKNFLEKGKAVLFTGAPCQIAGLRAYLRKEYTRLLCVDIVCHGVPCSKTLEHYIDYQEKRMHKKITAVHFRKKHQLCEGWNSKCVEIVYEEGNATVEDPEKNPYMRGFSYGLFFRPSCSKCPFSTIARCSDITIGDAWGVERMYPELNVHQGISLLIANSQQGVALITHVKRYMTLRDVSIDTLVSGNARLRAPDKGHGKREQFFQHQDVEKFDRLVYQCIPKTPLIRRLGHRLKCALLFSTTRKKMQDRKKRI